MEMGSFRKSPPTMFVALAILFQFFSHLTLGRSTNTPYSSGSGLGNYSEIQEAKSLINDLSSKLHTKLKTYQDKYKDFQQQSSEYMMRSGATLDEIKLLNKLKGLLNDLTKMGSICEKFYTNFDFIASRKINISSSVPLPKGFTVTLEVNHRDLIDKELALSNGNDLRVYFLKDDDCQQRQIDRIVENIGTTKATVLFKLQEDLLKTLRDGSAYFLVYGNKNAGKAKHNPENVYLFYDDFSDSNLEKRWQKHWGTISVKNGLLNIKTGKTPTGDAGEISTFVKHGHDWKDIEVQLDLSEKNDKNYPGPFLRVQDPRIQSTTAWWFEYHSGHSQCTMRPFQNNEDGSWLYKSKLKKVLAPGSWIHAKYRVVGDRFSHWVNGDVVHDDIKVASKWMIDSGTFGLGCHSSNTGCNTSYDNIKIIKYVPVLPVVSLEEECKVDLKTFHGIGVSEKIGTSEKIPANSCKQIHDTSLKNGKQKENGVYWIKTSADSSAPTYCDLANGGWTLVGKVSGSVDQLYKFWLIENRNLGLLQNAALPSGSGVGCIDARFLATNHASTVMFSSGENPKSIGSKWVRWPLPEGRESDSFWTHSIGRETVAKAKMNPVTVTAWDGSGTTCYQNKYGIMPYPGHGGSYPSASYDTEGNSKVRDYCMAIGVLKRGKNADGWTQNVNGYDSPRSNSDWPNSQYNHQSPYVTVWLK